MYGVMGNRSSLLLSITLIAALSGNSRGDPGENRIYENARSLFDSKVDWKESPNIKRVNCGSYTVAPNDLLLLDSHYLLEEREKVHNDKTPSVLVVGRKGAEREFLSCSWAFSAPQTCELEVEFKRNLDFPPVMKSCSSFLTLNNGVSRKIHCLGTEPRVVKSPNGLLRFDLALKRTGDEFLAIVSCNPQASASFSGSETVVKENDEFDTHRIFADVTNDIKETANCTCGIKNQGMKIVGGTEAQKNEYPWMVALFSKWRQRPFCGGALISENLILTAAHCLLRAKRDEVEVVVGAHGISNLNSSHRMEVSEVIIHESYSTTTLAHDIAILKLKEKVKLSHNIQTLCIPTKMELNRNLSGISATLTGWGALYEGGPPSNTMQKVQVEMITKENCEKFYHSELMQTMICAGYPEGMKDSCQGDSGGPMTILCNDQIPNQYCIAGIVSWGSGCARPSYPGVYTNAYYKEIHQWILNIVKESGNLICSRSST